MHGPDPMNPAPMPGFPRVCFLKPVVQNPLIEVGEYTYYDDPDAPEDFESRNVLYHYDFIGDRLVIGRFCAIATGATFIMNGANHALDGFSTYPFQIFGQGWEAGFDAGELESGSRGDTVVGHDVWIGRGAVILPGVRIGHGAIIGAHAVVSRDVPDYAVAAGNPAEIRKMRFDPGTIQTLLEAAWWGWPAEKITRHLNAIRGGDVEALKRAGGV
jgi:virginiamycin A acetyltransferase